MSTHKDFCDWLIRNHGSLSVEALDYADQVARWLYLMERGVAGTDVAERAAPAFRRFKELVGR